jgi:hypothetical protein
VGEVKALEKFNFLMNTEFMGMAHGGPISMEQLEAITIRCAIKAVSDMEGGLCEENLSLLSEELDIQGVKYVNARE